MSQQPEEPFRESDLESPEYRERLMRKLNCLIAVLEVANAKVRRSLAGPEPDQERLLKIQNNLTNTLDVCRRARRALERREQLPEGLPENLAEVMRKTARPEFKQPKRSLPEGAQVEMSSPEEQQRFTEMGRIKPREILDCNFDELARKLTD